MGRSCAPEPASRPTCSGRCACPRHPLAFARFGLHAACARRTALAALALRRRARAGAAGGLRRALDAARSSSPFSASFGLVLGLLGHAVGWPIARGGSQAIADAMASYLRALGGEIRTGVAVALARRAAAGARGAARPHAAPGAAPRRAAAAAAVPRAAAALPLRAGRRSSSTGRWTGRSRGRPGRARGRARVHLGGTLDEIAAAERDVGEGREPERPFVLLAQQSLFDPTRAPAGRHTGLGVLPRPQRLGRRHDRRASRPRSSASRRASATGIRARARDGPRRRWSATTPTTSAATSTAAPRTRASCSRAPCARPVPYATPLPGPVPVLVVDAARRRGARHVRGVRRAGGAAPWPVSESLGFGAAWNPRCPHPPRPRRRPWCCARPAAAPRRPPRPASLHARARDAAPALRRARWHASRG